MILELECVVGRSIQEVYHKDKLPKEETVDLRVDPSISRQNKTNLCSKKEKDILGLRVVEQDYLLQLKKEDGKTRKIEYDGRIYKLW